MIHAVFDRIQSKRSLRLREFQFRKLFREGHQEIVCESGGAERGADTLVFRRSPNRKRGLQSFRTVQRKMNDRTVFAFQLRPVAHGFRTGKVQIDMLPAGGIGREHVAVVLRNGEQHGVSRLHPVCPAVHGQPPLPFERALEDAEGTLAALQPVPVIRVLTAVLEPARGQHDVQMKRRVRKVERKEAVFRIRPERHVQNPLGISTNAHGMPNFSSTRSFTARTPGISLR